MAELLCGRIVFKQSNIAHLVVHKNKVIGMNSVKGLVLIPKEKEYGIEATVVVEKGVRIENMVHLCFGILPKEGIQEIYMKVRVEDGGGIKLLAHCVFPNAVKIIHRMQADIDIGNNSYYEYNEVHFHGEEGGVEVIPKAKIKMGKNSSLVTNFSLLKGRVGYFDLDYESEIRDNSTLEMTAKIYGYGDDRIKIREVGHLLGRGSKGVIKSRVAVRDNAISEIINELNATAPEAKGHVDCIEIIQGNAQAKAIPIVNVTNEFAKVTHEAAIGRVDKKQVETLMSRGLEEEEAIDIVVRGMFK
ncbi:MAG: SufD family Fe-S cluster assembly protein [Candidatus Omnitrophica bacterium]|nr:SufD family Fe-S cluster assembly protein [Candidatus Omnitrophota bacterium]